VVVPFYATNIGFRTICVAPEGVLLLNGRPFKLKGVNRHEFNARKGIGSFASFPPAPGLTASPSIIASDHSPTITASQSSKQEAIQDVKLIKQNNFNTIRLSYYPNDYYLYLLCDYYGLYVVDEANIETHGLL